MSRTAQDTDPAADLQVYLVGGAVRDELLGLEVGERDWVVVGSTPQRMAELGYQEVGKDFPVFLHPQTKEEYALARTERKSGRGYKGFVFDTAETITLEEDLRRRDITINAIAKGRDGQLIDPYEGRRDLTKKLIRHVSPAFIEDPLRALRVARFAAQLDFTVAAETRTLLQDISAAGELDALTPERVWMETEKALCCARPARYFETLRDCGALARLFPEVDCLFGVPQPEQHHPEIDTGIHTMMTLEQAALLSDEPEVRFAALVHDLGKGNTPRLEWPAHRGHEERGVALVENLCQRLRAPRKYQELARLVSRHHLDCHRVAELRPTTVLNRLTALDAFRRPMRFKQFLLACEADSRGRTGYEKRDYPQAALFEQYRLACREADTSLPEVHESDGKKIAEHIRRRRLAAIRKVAANKKTPSGR